MKKTFWMIYAGSMIVLIAGGYFYVHTINTKNEILSTELSNQVTRYEKVSQKMKNETLPAKTWPDLYRAYRERLEGAEKDLHNFLNTFNKAMDKSFEEKRNELFHGEYKKRWLKLLTELLSNGVMVGETDILLDSLKDDFENYNEVQNLGLPMDWVSGTNIATPTPSQRKKAEQHYWLYRTILKYFLSSEMQNGNWKEYKYRRDQKYIKSLMNSMDTGRNQYSTEDSIKSIAVLHMKMGAKPSGLGRRKADASQDYIIKKGYMNELPFSVDLKMRGSSLPSFIEGLSNDKDFLFELENVKVIAINDSNPDKKDGRSNEKTLVVERELPLLVHIEGNIITFDFKRLFEKPEKKTNSKTRKTHSRTTRTHR